MTWVTCRCGHGFETRAESRTTCRMCKSAVTVPRSATSVHYSGGEGASGASRPQVAMIGLGFVGWGVWSLRKWNASDPATLSVAVPRVGAHQHRGGVRLALHRCLLPLLGGVMTPELLDVAVRAWALPDGWSPREAPRHRHKPRALVVLDCETELAGRQSLIVGCYQYVRVRWRGARPTFSTVEEGLIVPDDADPEDLGRLRWYAAAHDPDVDDDTYEVCPNLRVLTRHEFCEHLLWEACYRNKATLVGFNLGFDLSRLALSAHPGRGAYSGGFVLRLWQYNGGDHRFRPNVVARRIDNKRTLFSWTVVVSPPDDGAPHRASDDHFLDLRTLVFGLRSEGHSLESACEAFGRPYRKRRVELGQLSEELIDYVREDVAATTDLAQATLAEFSRHPIPLSADRAFSPSALGRAYLAQMGITPPLTRSTLTQTELAEAMEAFYGPRVEVRIRHVPVPVTLVDFSSQYANVARLLGIFDLLRAETLQALDATEEVQLSWPRPIWRRPSHRRPGEASSGWRSSSRVRTGSRPGPGTRGGVTCRGLASALSPRRDPSGSPSLICLRRRS